MGLGVYNGSWEPQWVPGLSRGPKTQWSLGAKGRRVWDRKELQGYNGAQAPNGPGNHDGGPQGHNGAQAPNGPGNHDGGPQGHKGT